MPSTRKKESIFRSEMTTSIRSPRILLYSHDTYGLGHIRRTLAIAEQIATDIPNAHQLLITGSMVAGAFHLPPNLDLIKLPALSKHSSGQYKPRALPLTLSQTMGWREQMILQATEQYEPDLILVDKAPAGVQGELLPTLRHIKAWRPQTRIVLGMRDIEDDPATTCAEWDTAGTRRLHDEIYDAILLYGLREVFDPVSEYQMSKRSAAKMIACGYLGRTSRIRSPQNVRRELDAGERPLIVVTAGGGGDGFELIRNFLEAQSTRALRDACSFVVTGPLMPQGKRALLNGSAGTDHVTITEFTPDMMSYLAAADLVVSMAGYNTVCEILSLGVRSLFIPRVKPRREQQLRAERLAERGLARVLLPDQLTPAHLAEQIEYALASPPPKVPLDLGGLSRVSQAISEQLAQGREALR